MVKGSSQAQAGQQLLEDHSEADQLKTAPVDHLEAVLDEAGSGLVPQPAEIVELAGLFEAKVISVQDKSLTIQMVGEQDRINDLLKLLKPFGILDISRSGVIAVARSE